MIAEPSPQLRPAAQRWGRRQVLDVPDVPPTRLPAASPTPNTAPVATKTAESPHSGDVTEQSAPTTIDLVTATHTGSPRSMSPAQSSIVPAISATAHVDSPHDVPVAAHGSSLPVPPPAPGVFHDWQPAARASVAPVDQTTDSSIATGRKAKVAMMLMALCGAAILAVIVLSAVRLSGLADLGLSSDQMSSAFRREAMVWVPVVAICSVGLAAASLFRAKLN